MFPAIADAFGLPLNDFGCGSAVPNWPFAFALTGSFTLEANDDFTVVAWLDMAHLSLYEAVQISDLDLLADAEVGRVFQHQTHSAERFIVHLG